MSEIDDALARLERAVARLEAAARLPRRTAPDDRTPAIAADAVARIDAALARLGQLLEAEG